MRIVQVIHGFPPYNAAGSELYTYNLSRELSKKEEIYVFYRIADPKRDEYEMRFENYNGIKVCNINNTFRYCESFEKAYNNDIISKKFGLFLDQVKPDIIHFGHLTCLSTSLVEEGKKRKIPIVFTLHDFWLLCQYGQLLKNDLSICCRPVNSECVRCLEPKLSIRGNIRKVFGILKRKIPEFENRASLGKILVTIFRQFAKASLLDNDSKARVKKRMSHVNEMCSLVDIFISPSKFLLEKFVAYGIPRDKIRYHDYGFNTDRFKDFSKVKSQKLRFGYIGTFIPSKGVHVLLKAFSSIQSENVELRLHGKSAPYHPGFEDYPDYLRSLGKKSNILWFGEYNNEDIAEILSEIDVIIVPSIWYENSPLTIHEAFIARIPVITSNIGGMAELVQHQENGLLFRLGDSKDLAKKMEMILHNPLLVKKLSNNIKPVISIENHALEISRIYRDLISNTVN